MSNLQIFENPEFGSIRTVEMDGEPWLVGKDVATALGYSDTAQAVRNHVDEEDKGVVEMTTPGGKQKIQIINESGLYSLILSSKLPSAKKFKRWVTSEVLPSIRKNGGYLPPAVTQTLADLTAAVQLLTERLDTLGEREAPASAPLTALPPGTSVGTPGLAAKKRWMRTVNEKLDLLSARKLNTHSNLLHQIYQIVEQQTGISLDEERLAVMEELGLTECSVLAAIFYTDDLKESFEQILDCNLAPENRGW